MNANNHLEEKYEIDYKNPLNQGAYGIIYKITD